MTRVLHILDHSLPLHSGYTFRTRAILKSLQASGIDVRGVCTHPEARTGTVLHYRSDKHECGYEACRNPDHGIARSEAVGPVSPALPSSWPTVMLTGAAMSIVNCPFASVVRVPRPGGTIASQ